MGRRFKTVLWITVGWTLVSIIELLFELTIIKEYGLEYRWSTTGNFMTYFLINTLAFVLNGFIAGLIVEFFLHSWIRNRSYGMGLLFGVSIYTVLFFFLTCLQNYFVIQSIWDGESSFSSAYFQGLEDYFFSYEFIRMFPFWLLILIGTLIILFINDKYGPGELQKFLLGKYFQPKSEERIFMFLDLKGSTSIAEKLGEKQYFKFLQQVFKDVTPAILATAGEIYQYVGDEIVISWKIKTGIKNSNCIRCFQKIKKLLNDAAPSYRKSFGAVPTFKAGLHVGNAIVGEIGVIKRDIVYSGDVLNTTARIQSRCNEFGASLLVSEELLRLFPSTHFPVQAIGEVRLRGKAAVVQLFSIA